MRAAGGEVFAITSEPQSLARNAQEDWATGLEHVGDPHHEIADVCRDRGWLSLFSNHWDQGIVGAESTWMSHIKGYFQPGVLVLSGEGRVLYRWRCRPTRANVGGAIARPTPDHVWTRVAAAVDAPPGTPDAVLDADPALDHSPAPWPVFVALLMANGWFLRPAAFDYAPDGPSVRRRQQIAFARLVLFAAGWIAAAIWLPTPLVALVFTGWALVAWPGLRRIHDQFPDGGRGRRARVTRAHALRRVCGSHAPLRGRRARASRAAPSTARARPRTRASRP